MKKIIIALISALFYFLSPFWLTPLEAKEFNILLITIDTLRFDRLSIYSSRFVRTPYIDDLARQSTIFINAYAHNPLTRPSHANILTGTTPLYHGVSDNPGFHLEDRYLTLAEYLKEFDYSTAAFVGAFILDSRCGLDQGFDVYNDDNGEQGLFQLDFVERRAAQVIKLSQEWIGVQKKKWFCWVHLFDPHDPYDPPEPYRRLYKDDLYSGEVAYVDSQLGLLFDFLKKKGLMDKTVIILTSDHGEALGERGEKYHGFFAYNNTLHIPLILYEPGARPAIVEENVCHIDIFPTICDLLALPRPSHLQGESLRPLRDGKKRQRPLIYFESMAPYFSLEAAPLSGFIEGHIKFIDQPLKEIYDLKTDPLEENNLAAGSAIPEFLKKLEMLKRELKGKGTKRDVEGKEGDIQPLLQSLGYVAGQPSEKKNWGPQDDLKALMPVVLQARQALEQYRRGNINQAIAKLNNVIRIRPNYISAISHLASLYFNLGQTGKALEILNRGLNRNPDNIHLAGQLGLMLVQTKNFSEAIPFLEYVCEKDRSDPDYFNYLGLAYMGVGSLEKAREMFKEALRLDPDLVSALNNLGYLNLTFFVKEKNEKYLEMALENFDLALKYKPDLEPAIRGKEITLHYKNDFDKN